MDEDDDVLERMPKSWLLLRRIYLKKLEEENDKNERKERI
jgi:hypothetical protein